MAKYPAFLFYPNDYIGGTMGMTFEEKGAYIELLMVQFNRGHMTNDMIAQTVGRLWDKVKDKFVQDADGLWYNERLEQEKEKRAKFTESRRNNKNGTNQYSKNKEKKEGHMTSHMENENENINNGVYNKERGYGGKPKKGEKAISFSEDGEYAIFACGYKQKLGELQKQEIQSGWTKPRDIIYNSVY